MTALWWIAVLGFPLLSALALYRWPTQAGRWLWIACLPALAAACWPPAEFQPLLWPGASWGLDEIRRPFLAFSAGVWLAATLYAGRDNPGTPYNRWFWMAWMLTVTGNLLLIVSRDGAGFYVGYSVMSLSAYILIAHGFGSPQRKGGRLYLQMAIVSELLIFAGLMLRLAESASVAILSHWQADTTAPVTALLLLVGFGIKLGIWPLQLWMPFAYYAARPVVCAVLSGAMMATAALGLWTFLPVQSPLLARAADGLLTLAVVSAFYGVAAGLAQKDCRKLLAYSSVSQAGYLLAIVALAWHQPDQRAQWGSLLLVFTAHHGLAKSALFLGAGLAAARRLRPLHWLLMAVPALALAGLPLSTGAVAKTLLEKGVEGTGYHAWAPVMLAGSLATTLLVLRALWLMYCSQPGTRERTPPDARMLAWAALSLSPLALPWLWPALAGPLHDSLAQAKVLTSLGLMLLALAIAGISFRVRGQPPRLAWYHHPGMIASLRLKRLIDNATLPVPGASLNRAQWRRRERRWNRYWAGRNTVGFSTLVLAVLLLAGWVWGL